MNDIDPISKVLGTESGMGLVPVESKTDSDDKKDYETARSNMHNILEQAMEQLPELMDLARQSQSEKVYMALSQMIKTLTDSNVQLAKLSKESRTPKAEVKKETPQSVTQNNVYIGTTEDYLRELSQKKKQESIIDIDAIEVDDG